MPWRRRSSGSRRPSGVRRVRSFYSTGLRRLVSEDEHTTYAPIELSDEEEAKAKIPEIRDALRRDLSADIDEAYVIGFPAVSYDISAGSAEDLHHAELTSLPLTIFLLLAVFGTIVAAGCRSCWGGGGRHVARAAVSRRAADGDLDLRHEHGVDDRPRPRHRLLAADGQPLPRGAGEGDDGPPRRSDTVADGRQVDRVLGLTVMLGLSVMLLYDLTLVRSIALGMLLVGGPGGGRRGDAAAGADVHVRATGQPVQPDPGRKVGAQQQVGTGKWHAWSLLVMKYPWMFLFLALAFLAMSWPAKDMNAIGAAAAGRRRGGRVAQGVRAARTFPIGEVAPISIIVRCGKADCAFDPNNREGVWKLTKDLEADERVARVESIANLNPSLTLEQFKAITPEQLVGTDPRQRGLIAQYVNIDRAKDTYHISVISKHPGGGARDDGPGQGDPDDVRAADRELRGSEFLVTASRH